MQYRLANWREGGARVVPRRSAGPNRSFNYLGLSKRRNYFDPNYVGGKLLGREVLVEDITKLLPDLVLGEKTTAAVVILDGGIIVASFK